MAVIRPDRHQGRVQFRPDCDHSWKATRGATVLAGTPVTPRVRRDRQGPAGAAGQAGAGGSRGTGRGRQERRVGQGPAGAADYMKALGGRPSRLLMGSSFSSFSMKMCDCTAVQMLLVSQ